MEQEIAKKEGRTIEGPELDQFTAELGSYIAGLELALADPYLEENLKTELQAELDGLQDSLQEIQNGESVKIHETDYESEQY